MIKKILFAILIVTFIYPKEALMSGMAAASASSKYYSFYIDTGISESISPPPWHDYSKGDYVSNYFKSENKKLLEIAAKNMAFIDRWAEDEIKNHNTPLVPYLTQQNSAQINNKCNDSQKNQEYSLGTESIHLFLKNELPENKIKELQDRFCSWKKNHLNEHLIPIELIHVNHLEKTSPFGHFLAVGDDVRNDLSEQLKERQKSDLEKWSPVVEKTINIVQNKYKIHFQSQQPTEKEINAAHRIDISWGCVQFTTWLIEKDSRFAEDIVTAFESYAKKEELNAKLIDQMPEEAFEFFNNGDNLITAAERDKMKNEVVEIEKTLSDTFKDFGVSVSINIGKSATYEYDWEVIQRLHANLPLFKRLVAEAKEIGLIMKSHGVTDIDFNGNLWDDEESLENFNMNITTNKMKKNHRWSMDFNHKQLRQEDEKKEFYDMLLGLKEY